LTSKQFSLDAQSNRYTPLDKQLFFLLHEAGFTTKQIRYNPLLLTTEKTVITERLLFLRHIGRHNFDINAEGTPEHVPIAALCQEISAVAFDPASRRNPTEDLEKFLTLARVSSSEYFDFLRLL
jgi:hypothetical protein